VRDLADAYLADTVVDIHTASRGSYCGPRIHGELRLGIGIRVGRKRVARLLRLTGRAGIGGNTQHRRHRRPIRRHTKTESSAVSSPIARTDCGAPTSPSIQPGPGRSTAAPCSTCSAAPSWAGRSPTTSAPNSPSTPCRWRPGGAGPSPARSCTTTAAASVGSTGRRNTSIRRWCVVWRSEAEGGSRVPGADPVPGSANDRVARGSGQVLGGDRSWCEDRGRGGRGRRIRAGRVPSPANDPGRRRGRTKPPLDQGDGLGLEGRCADLTEPQPGLVFDEAFLDDREPSQSLLETRRLAHHVSARRPASVHLVPRRAPSSRRHERPTVTAPGVPARGTGQLPGCVTRSPACGRSIWPAT